MDNIKALFEFALPALEHLPGLRAFLGFVIVFLLPGFTWTLIFFKQINVVERIALSFGLSIALVTLSILSLNKLIGMKVTGFNSLMIIITVTIIPVAIYYLSRFIRQRQGDTDNS